MRLPESSSAPALAIARSPIAYGPPSYGSTRNTGYRSAIASNAETAAVWSTGTCNKPKHWITGQYFGKFSKFRDNHWVFGDRDSGTCLVKFSWTHIERHVPVKGASSPDDPALAAYWAERRRRVKPPLDRYTLCLLTRQAGRCALCGDYLLAADQPPQSPTQWERWWLQVTRKAIAASYLTHHRKPGPADGDQTRLVHASCQRGLQARQRRNPALQPATPSRHA